MIRAVFVVDGVLTPSNPFAVIEDRKRQLNAGK